MKSALLFVPTCVRTLAVVLAIGVTTLGAEPIGTVFTYQGQLKAAGVPLNDTADFEFTLWDAEAGPNQVGSMIPVNDREIVHGLFTLPLDFGANPYTTNEARWLQIAVRTPAGVGDFITLDPRQELTPAPFSLATRGINVDDDGKVGIGMTSPGHPLHVEATWSRVIYAKNTAPSGGTGVEGEAAGTGVHGISWSPNGTGVHGDSAQNGYGVFGYTNGGTGVRGEASGTSGLNFGVVGKTSSPDGWGGYFIGRGYFSGEVGIGEATEPASLLDVVSTEDAHGIRSTVPWIPIWAHRASTTGSWPAIHGECDSEASNGSAIRGIMTSTSPGSSSAAVRGSNRGTGVAGIGVWGSQDGSGYGVFGHAPSGRGVYGSSTSGVGVYGSSSTGYAGFFNGRVAVDVLEIRGADLAEKFPVSEEVKPGMVVAIDPKHPGNLCLAREAYDRRVAGVVSGANDLLPGAVLGHLPGNEDAPAVALSGRVWVYCDATEQPIEPGDLLTTAATPGHAMKVIEYDRAHGAVIGKAMTSLARGRGLVLVLVSLQ